MFRGQAAEGRENGMDEITAESLMIPLDSYPHVPYWFTLRQAIVEMEKTQLEVEGRKSLPRVVLVFDEEYRLIGMVRRRDILRGMSPDALQEAIERRGEHDPGLMRDRRPAEPSKETNLDEIRKRAERPVQEVMTPIRISVPHDARLMEIIQVLVVNDSSLVPVLKDNLVSGVIRSTDVLHAIGKLIT